jgi:hypothetical protein
MVIKLDGMRSIEIITATRATPAALELADREKEITVCLTSNMANKVKAIRPSAPTVVKRVRNSFDEVEYLKNQLSPLLRAAGLKAVKAMEKLSGPTPKSAVVQFLSWSTAIDHP